MMCGIYKITNIVNGKVYIGQSQNIEERWRAHRSRPFQVNSNYRDNYLYRAIRKYGLSCFLFEVIEECLLKDLDTQEKFWIAFYKSNNFEFGYNMTEGGEGTKGIEIKLSREQVDEVYSLLLTSNLSQQEIANKYNVSQYLISLINRGIVHIKEGCAYPLRDYSLLQKREYLCKECGERISKRAERCVSCTNKFAQKTERPTREELKDLIRHNSFVKIGEIYSVSDNAIRKWCDSYGLPRKKTEIKKYSEEEWKSI